MKLGFAKDALKMFRQAMAVDGAATQGVEQGAE